MRIRIGCELTYDLPQPVPMIAMLTVLGCLVRIALPTFVCDAPTVSMGSFRPNALPTRTAGEDQLSPISHWQVSNA